MLMQKVETEFPLGNDGAEIGPFSIARMTRLGAIQLVRSSVQTRKPLDIAICNAHTILTALDDPSYATTLRQMTLLNDGIGIDLASRFLDGEFFPANLNGTDLVPSILEEIGIPLRIYLLGASEHHVQLAKAHIERVFPSHKVVGYRNGYFDMNDCSDVCADINISKPDLLLVAMGNPRQENFIVHNRAKLDVTVAIGVGALFDFMSGSVMRAPKAVQSVGLEWLFRLLQEPRRLFRRYVVGIPRFFYALAKMKFNQSHKKF
ncbi:MAG: WecB/TagA/CpsF family glycosyltransferase [Roseibium sp.]|uniref:WecB/TagA/CpsF family glycosyltransferase n=1 Tax=Roseibium sp. TaxID=1936156 RepID=UPI0026230B52|nr:WecB/TagA/CpsF family glycosyltransferase [Roseibium sp.]MCV0426933.1 WecB/TagA/CpsF family glycosyltransferase [Roseibium sp.]